MSSTRTSRRIAADPTSVALLLADPTTVELWPRLLRTEGSAGHDAGAGLVTIEVGGAAGALRLLPPSRTPTAFILRFDFDARRDGDVADVGSPTSALRVEGRLELSFSCADEGTPATEAVLEVRSERDLSADAAEFLRRVADAAERRASAA